MAQVGEDCHFFLTSGCTKGDECGFRHSQGAKESATICHHWLKGTCGNMGCMYRHPSIPRPAAPFPPAYMGFAGRGAGRGGGRGVAPGVCSFFLAGTCRNGIECAFLHPQQQRGQQRQHLQQQQYQAYEEEEEVHFVQKPERLAKKLEKKPEKRVLTKEERQEIMAKPLSAPTGASSGAKKKNVVKKKVEEPIKEPEVKKPKISVKTLDQILVERGAAPKSVTSPVKATVTPTVTPKVKAMALEPTKKNQAEKAVDDELLSLGLDPNDFSEDEGAGASEDLDIGDI